MGSAEFGRWVDQKMRAWVDPKTGQRGMKPGRLASRIGELSDGRTFDYTGVKLMYTGRRRDYDTELVTRIARALDEDPLVACNIAGVEPPDYDVEEYRRFRAMVASGGRPDAFGPPNEVTARILAFPGQRRVPAPVERRRGSKRRRGHERRRGVPIAVPMLKVPEEPAA